MIKYIGISPITITDQQDYEGKGNITNSGCNKKLLTEAIQVDFKEMNDKGLAKFLDSYYDVQG